MSGSTDASTLAEKAKLEAQLREANESLNDTYYNHAMDSQSNALDDELESFTQSSEDYLEALRESIKNTDLLIEQTFTDVMQNGQIVLETLTTLSNTYGIQLDGYLTSPWKNATSESLNFETYATYHFNAVYTAVETKTSELTGYVKAPWEEGQKQASAFSSETQKYVGSIVTYAEEEYKIQLTDTLNYPWEQANGQASWGKGIKEVLDKAVTDAEEAGRKIAKSLDVKTPSHEGTGTGDTGSGRTDKTSGYVVKPVGGAWLYDDPNTTALQNFLNANWNTYVLQATGSAQLGVDGDYGPNTQKAVKAVQEKLGVSQTSKWDSATVEAMKKYYGNQESAMRRAGMTSSVKDYQRRRAAIPKAFFANGTLGTTKDQFAITDESWIGEEITLAAGKNGQLQYLKKGSAVMPADISANLVEWGKLNPNMMSFGDMSGGIQMMSNYVNKPEIKLDIENFLNVGTVSKDTLPELEKLMDRKIDTFAKQLNASIRKFK